ncbi:MAG: protein kinase [Planctomycetaceae bacterium]|nr:protein kinase [Planctomycetaceae bacterium]
MRDLHIGDDQLTDYLLGRLADADHAAVEDHLDQCSECEQRAAAATPSDPLVGLLSSVSESEPDESANLASNLSHNWMSSGVEANSPSAQSQVPRELLEHGRYRVIRPLGSGAMGTVWLAEHMVMQRLVALKVMRPEWIGKAGALERFSREVHAAAKLKHINVVDAYDAEHIGDTLFLVAEYVDGETLAELLLDGSLPVTEACRAVRDAACGLAHAHDAGLVHRDVKPSNLIRSRTGVVKVLDFGLVMAFRGGSSLTGANMLVGTPDYVAPEQAEDPTRADARSDLYSLGCTLYHLLGGEPPFNAVSTLKKLDAHRYTDPPRLRKIPTELQRILSRMMAKKPNERFQSATEVVEALKPFCEEFSHRAEAKPPRANRLSLRFALLSISGVIVGLAALWVYLGIDWQGTQSAQHARTTGATEMVSQSPGATRAFPLLTPTSVGDGQPDDYHVEDQVLTLNAMQNSPQVWLNFDVVRSNRISVFAKIRILEATPEANVKLVLLSPGVGDYSLQYRPDEQVIVLHAALHSGVGAVGEYKLPTGSGQDWLDVEFRLRGDQMTGFVDGHEVLRASCDGSVSYFPCIAALHCVAEVSEPRAEVPE